MRVFRAPEFGPRFVDTRIVKARLHVSSCRKWTGKSAAELKSQLTRLKGMLEKES